MKSLYELLERAFVVLSKQNLKEGIRIIIMEDEPTQTRIWTRDFILIALINLTTFIGFNMVNTGMPVYVSSLGASDVIVGLVTTFSTGAALLVRPFAGLMLDRFGRKGILVVNVAAMSVIIVAYAVFPLVAVILALRICHGVAWGLGSTAASTIAADAIPRRRFAEGMGYFAMTTALAVAIAPILTLVLLENVGIVPMIAVAATSTVASLVLALIQRSKQPPKPQSKVKFSFQTLFDRRALLPALMVFLITCAFGAITTFIFLHGQEQGVDNIFLYFTVYAVITLVSRPFIGIIIDKSGFFLPGIFSILGVIITLFLIAISTNIILFCIAGVFAGLGIGTGMATFQTMAVAAVPSKRRGIATSTYLFGLDGGIALGALVAGILSGIGSYGTMYLIMILFPVLALLVFLGAGKQQIATYSLNNEEEA